MARDDWLFVDRAPEYRRAAREPPTNRIHAAPTTRVPTAVVGRVAPGGQLPLTWPRHTGPPRAPTRGSRGGLALPSPDTRERRGVGNSNWSPPTARALILLDAITFSLSLSLSLFACFYPARTERKSIFEPDTGISAQTDRHTVRYGFFSSSRWLVPRVKSYAARFLVEVSFWKLNGTMKGFFGDLSWFLLMCGSY